jgi:hypothetical protein
MNCATYFPVEHVARPPLSRTRMNPDFRAVFIALAILIVLFGAGIVFD